MSSDPARDPGIELEIVNVPTNVNQWTVTREVAKVLHSDDFGSFGGSRLLNFEVRLNKNEDGGNKGTGTLILPVKKSGYKFLDLVRVEPIRIDGRQLRFYTTNRPPKEGCLQTLSKTPFMDPDLEEQRQDTLRALEGELRVAVVQFGVFYRDTYPSKSRSFSIEWERKYHDIDSYASLSFEYDQKLILLNLGNSLKDSVGYNICIRFASIRRIAVGIDFRPYICFETLTPPILEKIEFHRSLTGDKKKDYQKYKHRVGFLDEGHRMVSSYAPHLRVELFDDAELIDRFSTMCKSFGIAQSVIVPFPPRLPLLATKKGFFVHKRLHNMRKRMTFPWSVTFQLEALLLNGLLNTGELEELIPLVSGLSEKHSKFGPGYVADFLRYYHGALKIRKSTDSPITCFHERLRNFKYAESQSALDICCCHVTFTPTRILLEGPYATQSNRVTRQYQGYEDHFIRVDFRDEDMLQYHWDREVDGKFLLSTRVGDTLKKGFRLAGRQFEFLAYSNSALREHSVWFVNPFQHSSKGWIDGAAIRDSLGNFKGDALLKQPSKLAARLAQAFTATDASAMIRRCEWEEVEDIVCPIKPHLFTDGVGTISRDLAKRIWIKHCEDRHVTKPSLVPSAFQIRFLGYKGVVSVDDELDKTGSGIQMRLRESMRKFTAKNDEMTPIEIAQAFDQPKIAYLNRYLVMVLEDVGVRKEAFLTLQHNAVATARTIDESLEKFESIVSEHKMGSAFELGQLLEHLRGPPYHMELKSVDNPFLRKLRRVATTDILRGIKHGARIPISHSYLLVGVADEGPAYENRGKKDVFCLNEGEISVCIQKSPTSDPEWLEGNASISRSPVAHIGDVQRIRLVGKPPDGMFCAFRHLRNVVVMPSRGDRSLASCLGGGDLDGDEFSVIFEETLLPTSMEDPATYESAGTHTLDRECTVEDICDFVAEYIDSDVLGLLSNRLLITADQSTDGMKDEACTKLAALCSQAVDYPKRGIPVELDGNLPQPLLRYKPDWHAAEVVSPRKSDYYESSRALGYMFRAIQLEDPEGLPDVPPCTNPMSDPVTLVLFEKIQQYFDASACIQELPVENFDFFKHYQDELTYICATHTLSNEPEIKLLEEEVVIGTILAKCSQKRWRSNRIYRMRHHVGTLIKDIKQTLKDSVGFDEKVESTPARVRLLELGWKAWNFSIYKREEFGANSFGLIALKVVFDCLDALEKVSIFS